MKLSEGHHHSQWTTLEDFIYIILIKQLSEVWSHQCQIGLNLTARISVPTICPPLWTSEQCSVLDSGFSEKVNKINRSNFDHFIRFLRSFPKAPGLIGHHPFRGAPRTHPCSTRSRGENLALVEQRDDKARPIRPAPVGMAKAGASQRWPAGITFN